MQPNEEIAAVEIGANRLPMTTEWMNVDSHRMVGSYQIKLKRNPIRWGNFNERR